MTNQTEPKLPKWPFLIANLLMLGVAFFFVFWQSQRPLNHWEMALLIASGSIGAALGVVPFILEYKAATRQMEANALLSAASQIQNLEKLASQIGGATAQWQTVQEHSTRTAATAKQIADQIVSESQSFTEFLKKANDGEKANLRLEIEKLRRGEAEWLQVVVRLLDHTYALHQAAMRSRQPGLAEQLGNFQNACRDIARRVGLSAFAPAPNDPFDPQMHQLHEAGEKPQPGARVGMILATGYTFQGQMLRPALVGLHNEATNPEPEPAKTEADKAEMVGEQTLL